MMSTNDWGSLFQLEIIDGKNDVKNWLVEMNFELLVVRPLWSVNLLNGLIVDV